MITVSLGQASLAAGPGPNQDYSGCATPEGPALRDKGMAFAVADGVGRGKGGRLAAEVGVRAFLSDYYSSPDTWTPQKIFEHVLENVNASARTAGKGAAAFAGLVLRGRRYFTVHAGDARVYRFRHGTWTCLTADHVWQHPDMRNVISRAIGLDEHLHADLSQGELKVGDVYLLCTDGFYKSVEPATLFDEPRAEDLQAVAETLAARAKGHDDVTLQIVRVETLPDAAEGDGRQDAEGLPFASASVLREGATLDDFYLRRRVHRGLQSEVYLAEDLRNRRQVAIKFLLPPAQGSESAAEAADRFLREEWLGRRVKSPHVLPVLPLESGRRSSLYYVSPWEPGETLHQRIKRAGPLSAAEAVEVGIQLCRGLEALHRLQVLHRDIKPDNVLLCEDGRVLLLDLGVARAGAFSSEEGGDEATPGTPSYMAPEMFRGAGADERTEVYALGATLYEALTRKLPFGPVEPFSQPKFQRWTPPSRYNLDIPHWLETVLQRASEPDPARRFQVLSEMQYCLDRREAAMEADESRASSRPAARRPSWKGVAVLFGAIALIEFILLCVRGVARP